MLKGIVTKNLSSTFYSRQENYMTNNRFQPAFYNNRRENHTSQIAV